MAVGRALALLLLQCSVPRGVCLVRAPTTQALTLPSTVQGNRVKVTGATDAVRHGDAHLSSTWEDWDRERKTGEGFSYTALSLGT